MQIVLHINMGGSLPGPMRSLISKKQAGIIDTLQSYFAANAAEMEESFRRSNGEKQYNLTKQKEEREGKEREAEEKKQREEARAKKKLAKAQAKVAAATNKAGEAEVDTVDLQ